MVCCQFRGHDDRIVTNELESGYDETEVQPLLQDRGSQTGDGSPLHYHYRHRAELELVVQAGTGRAGAFDELISAIGCVLEADRSPSA